LAKVETKTTIVSDGLRYKSKTPGSPFKATSSFGGATMSCFLCGKHRPRSAMKTRKVLGKPQAVCDPSCKAMDEAVFVETLDRLGMESHYLSSADYAGYARRQFDSSKAV